MVAYNICLHESVCDDVRNNPARDFNTTHLPSSLLPCAYIKTGSNIRFSSETSVNRWYSSGSVACSIRKGSADANRDRAATKSFASQSSQRTCLYTCVATVGGNARPCMRGRSRSHRPFSTCARTLSPGTVSPGKASIKGSAIPANLTHWTLSHTSCKAPVFLIHLSHR